jgi:Dyp-type peroxidase family
VPQLPIVLGIDTPPAKQLAILKIDIGSNAQEDALTALQMLGTLLSEFATLPSLEDERPSHSSTITALVGFSARFFKGPLSRERDAYPHATRFAITAPVPPGLKRMYARYDDRFPALFSDELIAEKESDLIVLCEAHEAPSLKKIINRLQALEKQSKFTCKTIHYGQRLDNGRDHLGFKDGISNLQDIRASAPQAYLRHVYTHDGEAGSPTYDGGTYLVFRKYIEHLDTWSSQEFCYQDNTGGGYHGNTARERAVGRSLANDLVIDSQTGNDLAAEFDEAQGLRTFDEAHIRQANPRGHGKTNFGAPVVVKNARILRRSFPFTEVAPETHTITQGLLFLCFQSNIQQRGFEFIHNEWLMSEFMGIRDKLLDPDSGIVEPIDGCYYFVPRVQMFPGDVFFTA